VRTVTTQYSVYEINEDEHLIRRVTGANNPTPHQGDDGQWQHYVGLPRYAGGLLIQWDADRNTLTSVIVSDVTT